MDYPDAVFLCGGTFALPWCAGGAGFGGIVHISGFLRHRTPETNGERALFVGMKRGAFFGAILGFLWGGAIGLLEQPDDFEELLQWLFISTTIVGAIALVAILIGWVANALEWLGTSHNRASEEETGN